MVKRVGLVIFAWMSIILTSFAQCVPDTSITHNMPGIYPDSATGLPHAFVGIPYSAVINVFVPVDTVYNGLPAVIQTITVTDVTGLPAGFTYVCTPSNCVFPGGTNACLLLQGPAPTVGMIGSYPILVQLSIRGTVFGVPQTIPDVVDNYTIVIESTTGLWSVSNGTFAVKQNAPNPFSRQTNIPLNSKVNGKILLKVSDLLGNVVLSEEREVLRGINNLSLDAAKFEAGIYLYTISDGKNSVTRRFVVSGANEF
jgi:hypothetical protein